MNSIVSWILVFLGPFAFVLVPQWLARRALQKKGLPESLNVARLKLLSLLLCSRISVSYRVDGNRDIPLQEMVGDKIPGTVRLQNQSKLQAYHRYLNGHLMLPVIYKMEPGIILCFIYAIVNIIAGPSFSQPGIQFAHTIGIILATIICATGCTMVVLAYIRVIDVLASIDQDSIYHEAEKGVI